MGRHRHHRQVAPVGTGANGACGLVTIQHGHLQVHQNHMPMLRASGFQQVESALAVFGHVDLGSRQVQQFTGELAIDRVVFHQQDLQSQQGLAFVGGPNSLCPCDDQGRLEHAAQRVRHDGFGQEAAGACLERLLTQVVPAVGGDHHHPGPTARAVLVQALQHLRTIHVRQHPIQQDEVEGLPHRCRIPAALQGLLATGHRFDQTAGRLAHSQGPQQAKQAGAGFRQVVHHQHPQSLHRIQRRCRLDRCELHRQAQREAGTCTQLAAHLDASAHQFSQTAGDGQAQPGAPETTRSGTVGLGELLEQPRELLVAEPHATVLDIETQPAPVVPGRRLRRGHPQAHMTALGELDGVGQQVGEDLPQTQRIAPEMPRLPQQRRLIVVAQQFDVLVLSSLTKQHQGVVHQLLHGAGNRLQRQLAGLDLGEVKDVVEDAQQHGCRAVHLVEVVALLGVQGGAQGEVGHADDGVHRRADFVAHVGQEHRLGLRGRLSLFAGGAQFLGVSVAHGDVAPDRAGHAVKRLPQRLDLIHVAALQPGARGVVTLRVAPRGFGQPVDWAQNTPLHYYQRHRHKDHHCQVNRLGRVNKRLQARCGVMHLRSGPLVGQSTEVSHHIHQPGRQQLVLAAVHLCMRKLPLRRHVGGELRTLHVVHALGRSKSDLFRPLERVRGSQHLLQRLDFRRCEVQTLDPQCQGLARSVGRKLMRLSACHHTLPEQCRIAAGWARLFACADGQDVVVDHQVARIGCGGVGPHQPAKQLGLVPQVIHHLGTFCAALLGRQVGAEGAANGNQERKVHRQRNQHQREESPGYGAQSHRASFPDTQRWEMEQEGSDMVRLAGPHPMCGIRRSRLSTLRAVSEGPNNSLGCGLILSALAGPAKRAQFVLGCCG